MALYNGARFIEKQLDSIRLQTRQPDQVVLCDDGSKDGTAQIVRAYILQHGLENKWHFYENETNLGYIRNFYRAISLCDADCVFLSDQDDLWREDKIEKMTRIMEQQENILLLSCKYGIIDADDNSMSSLLEKSGPEDEKLLSISVSDIMRAYRWPGMVMCIRKSFFDRIHEAVLNHHVAHDLMFAVLAADRGGFFEYHYVGAFHRRHDSNTAREEHRITKLLNLKRKLRDTDEVIGLWRNLLSEEIPMTDESRTVISDRLLLMERRRDALSSKNLAGVLTLYLRDGGKTLRLPSFVCDVWLALFGKLE
jgi:glycosyltransferase involved in cell wall biosynthesis